MDDVNGEDEWEYEYDFNATETFLVDLDLSSLNGVTKATAPASGRSLKKAPTKLQPKFKSTDAAFEPDNMPLGDGNDDHEAYQQDDNAESPGLPRPIEAVEKVQILDLPTHNPVVSYRDQVYSCKWADMIGTNMFFARPSSSNPLPADGTTLDYTLLGTSRLKLVGYRATLKPRLESLTNPKKRPRPIDADDDLAREFGTANEGLAGASLPGLTRTNPKTNIEIKAQNAFLEKLAIIKRAKGETDNVRFTADFTLPIQKTPIDRSPSENNEADEVTEVINYRKKAPTQQRTSSANNQEADKPILPITQETSRSSRRQRKPSAKQKEIDQNGYVYGVSSGLSKAVQGQLDGIDSETGEEDEDRDEVPQQESRQDTDGSCQ